MAESLIKNYYGNDRGRRTYSVIVGRQANGFLSAIIQLNENLASSAYSIAVEHIYWAGNSTDLLSSFNVAKNDGFIFIYTPASSSPVAVGDRLSIVVTIS